MGRHPDHGPARGGSTTGEGSSDSAESERGRDAPVSDVAGERTAQLPAEVPLPKLRKVVGSRSFAKAGAADCRQPGSVRPEGHGPTEPEKPHGLAPRMSKLATLRQSRTTLYEVGEVARRLSVLAPLAEAKTIVRQAVISFVVGLTLVLLATMALTGGTWRWVLGILAGTGVATLTIYASLRAVSGLASRGAARELPGPAGLWVGGIVVVAVSVTAGFTVSVSEATKPLAVGLRRTWPALSLGPREAPFSPARPRADAKVKRGRHVPMPDGVLYAPPSFESADGHFDLVIYYHGNVELVERSIAAAKLNALARIINFGESSGRYSEPLKNPFVFDNMLDAIETHAQRGLALKSPRIRRIALASWSAGFGALFHILSSRSRLDRVDAVLLMDSLHTSFAPGTKDHVYPGGLKPFLAFARRAVAGEGLMIVTHSAIVTEGYASTTQTADAILSELGLPRRTVTAASASPPPVDFAAAKRAFPTGERNWLRLTSEASEGDFHLYGYSGNGKGDHIAHLAQMSVTVLPPLVDRWNSRPLTSAQGLQSREDRARARAPVR